MIGLAAYGSSSEDESPREPASNVKKPKAISPQSAQAQEQKAESPKVETSQEPAASIEDFSKPLVGPFQPGRSISPVNDAEKAPRDQSPFSTTRALIHDMTLPPIPSLDIPPSPPGSPNPAANQKFAHFLRLKKQGVHFNEKLASNSSLRNPSLLAKLMSHAGIGEQDQYASSFPTDLWDISALPEWGYKEELNKSQQDIRRKIEEKKTAGQRDAVDFVSGGVSGESSRGGTPSSGRGRASAAERVMAGLSREKGKSPMGSGQSRRAELERRPRRSDMDQKRLRSRSPPSRRKRSRSR
ncbi:hypothetical protein AJ80_07375 [Polytolypa hystricis UAMH7299]|uniref:HCNGP-like protein n=1 Tax=Polytolypa hystricis (strain UAMH7299) TaxID=1447883 RepID=A0A2B7XGH3_POLH7|nr:hypothetical protein AJ80_07375 [Polytolypa hystricis UAMH7299]